jgi:hypothetical protein
MDDEIDERMVEKLGWMWIALNGKAADAGADEEKIERIEVVCDLLEELWPREMAEFHDRVSSSMGAS